MAPVSLGVQVAQVQGLLLVPVDLGDRAGDLAGDEGWPSSGGLVVEQDAVGGEHAVSLQVQKKINKQINKQTLTPRSSTACSFSKRGYRPLYS